MNDNCSVSNFQKLELNKFRKFLIPALAIGLIMNANFKQEARNSRKKLYPSKREAQEACQRWKAKQYATNEVLKKYNDGKYNVASSPLVFDCNFAPESRHYFAKGFIMRYEKNQSWKP